MSDFSRTELDAALTYLRALPNGSGREVSRALNVHNSTVNGWIKRGISPTGTRAGKLVKWHKSIDTKSDNPGRTDVRESSSGYLTGDRPGISRADFLEGVLFATGSMHEAIADIHRRARTEPWPPTAPTSVVEEVLLRDQHADEDDEAGGRTGTG
jgi:hypothetical protein